MSNFSLYQRFINTFESDTLCWVLAKTLDHSAVVKLCNICGVTFAGMRTKSLPTHKLVPDLVRTFYENPAHADAIIKCLARATDPDQAELRRQDIADISATTSDAEMNAPHLGRRIVAMLLDDRPEVHEAAGAMINQANILAQTRNENHKAAIMLTASRNPLEDKEDRGRHEKTFQEIQTAYERLVEQNSRLEKRVERLKERVKTLQLDNDTIRHENRDLQKTLAERERKIERLTEDLDETPALKAQIHKLERDKRKLSYEIERQQKTPKTTLDIEPALKTFEQNMFDIKDVMQSTVETIRGEQEGLKHIIDDLQKEVHTLRVEAQRAQNSEPQRKAAKGAIARVGIFVDVQNMFYAARQHGARLDFEKLMQAAVGNRRMIRAVAYVIQTPEVDQSGFVAMLQQRSYQVKRKDLRQRSDGSAKGDWDMGMAIDMISMADKLDVVVLVSGDGDFVSLVNLLKEIGPRVEIFSFPHNTARDLIEVADRHYPIDDTLLMKMDKPLNGEDRGQAEELPEGTSLRHEDL